MQRASKNRRLLYTSPVPRNRFWDELPCYSTEVGVSQIPGYPGAMTTVKVYRCEICGIESQNFNHWFVIHCSDEKLSVFKWESAAASEPGALHLCGERHAEIYVSRWFES